MSFEVELVTDLDCNHRRILNISGFNPPPPEVVTSNDPRLNDKRNVINGSVTNVSVSATANIDQSKLNLNGNIPPLWTSHDHGDAAPGNLVEYVSRKDAANGYPGLDVNGLLDLSVLPFTGPQTGTVTIIDIDFPDELKVVSVSGGLHFGWFDVPDNSWLGVNGPFGIGTPMGRPGFVTSQIPLDLIPSLDAAKFTTGIFNPHRLPIVKGLGTGHAKGILPDPGNSKGTQSDVTDYLGREGKWKSIYSDKDPQPMAPDVQITFLSFYRDQSYVEVRSRLKNGLMFYRISPSVGTGTYQESTDNPLVLLLDPGKIVNAYSAKAGYNNSRISQFVVPANPNL